MCPLQSVAAPAAVAEKIIVDCYITFQKIIHLSGGKWLVSNLEMIRSSLWCILWYLSSTVSKRFLDGMSNSLLGFRPIVLLRFAEPGLLTEPFSKCLHQHLNHHTQHCCAACNYDCSHLKQSAPFVQPTTLILLYHVGRPQAGHTFMVTVKLLASV